MIDPQFPGQVAGGGVGVVSAFFRVHSVQLLELGHVGTDQLLVGPVIQETGIVEPEVGTVQGRKLFFGQSSGLAGYDGSLGYRRTDGVGSGIPAGIGQQLGERRPVGHQVGQDAVTGGKTGGQVHQGYRLPVHQSFDVLGDGRIGFRLFAAAVDIQDEIGLF